jgi:hypothetical protein
MGIKENLIPVFRNIKIGLKAEQLPLWIASAKPLVKFGKKFIKQGINSSADKAKNMYDDEEEEEYC